MNMSISFIQTKRLQNLESIDGYLLKFWKNLNPFQKNRTYVKCTTKNPLDFFSHENLTTCLHKIIHNFLNIHFWKMYCTSLESLRNKPFNSMRNSNQALYRLGLFLFDPGLYIVCTTWGWTEIPLSFKLQIPYSLNRTVARSRKQKHYKNIKASWTWHYQFLISFR